MLKKVLNYLFQEVDKKALLLIFIGTFIWYLTTIKSGLIYKYGMGFWGAHGHDAVWHIALIESLSRGSTEIPVLSGFTLQNYHIGFDVFVALLHKITFIPVRFLYFQVLPPVFAFLIGLFSYKFVYSWTKSSLAAFWAVFFVYFGGGWGWLVHLVRYGRLGGDSMFWAQSSATTLVNPPFALSIVVLLLGMLIIQNIKKIAFKKIIIAGILFGLLIQIKIYAGLLVLTGLFVTSIYLWLKKKSRIFLYLFGCTLFVAILMFFVIPSSGRLISYSPFWFLEGLMTYGDRLHWDWYSRAMLTTRQGGIIYKALILYIFAFLIFWFGNLGTRVVSSLAIVNWIRNFRKLGWIEVFIGTVILAGIVVPILFVQSGTAWNTIQFTYYSLFFSGLLAGVAMPELIKLLTQINSNFGKIFTILTILLTLPTTLTTIRHYYTNTPPAKISNYEIEALKFLEKEPKGIVLSAQPIGMNYLGREAEAPKPLFMYDSTAYVSAFTKKPVYLEDEVNLTIMNYPWQERREKLDEFLKDSNSPEGFAFLRDEEIDYIYLVKRSGVGLDENALRIDNIFDNEEVIIYEVL